MTVKSLSWKDILDRKKFFLTKELMMAAAISVKYGYFNFDSKIYLITKDGYEDTGISEWDVF